MPLIAAAAATDPEIAAQWPAGPDPLNRPARRSEALTSEPDARSDVDTARAADLLYGLLDPELYLIFVRDRGWSTDAWEEWKVDVRQPGVRAGPARALVHRPVVPVLEDPGGGREVRDMIQVPAVESGTAVYGSVLPLPPPPRAGLSCPVVPVVPHPPPKQRHRRCDQGDQ
ncbi:hypothetical protein ACFYO5_10825 [Streptomyces sp. NPDC006259]|uniref:hypothetical protein n=1 Tax=Streptomyces sp. NPDC006259 TaxID=3364740 RepID=UPI0036D09613